MKYVLIALLGMSFINSIQSSPKNTFIGAIYRHAKTQNLYAVFNRELLSKHDALTPVVVYQGLYINPEKNPTSVQNDPRFLETTGKEIGQFSLVYESLSEEKNIEPSKENS